jgi:hypothetical protein
MLMKLLKMLIAAGAVAFIPASLLGQADPVQHLQAVLPADVAAQVIPIVQNAIAHGLPGEAVASVALQGVALGRSGTEVRAAAESMVADLQAAHDAIAAGGRNPTSQETQAGAMAMQQGVDGSTISALASSTPAGRSLTVPLAVLGELVSRGLPADNALQAVQQRLQSRSSDQTLAGLPDAAGQMLGQGMKPSEIGTALGSARAGFTVPASGVSVPAAGGVPTGVPANGGVAGKRPVTPPAGGRGGRGGGGGA